MSDTPTTVPYPMIEDPQSPGNQIQWGSGIPTSPSPKETARYPAKQPNFIPLPLYLSHDNSNTERCWLVTNKPEPSPVPLMSKDAAGGVAEQSGNAPGENEYTVECRLDDDTQPASSQVPMPSQGEAVDESSGNAPGKNEGSVECRLDDDTQPASSQVPMPSQGEAVIDVDESSHEYPMLVGGSGGGDGSDSSDEDSDWPDKVEIPHYFEVLMAPSSSTPDYKPFEYLGETIEEDTGNEKEKSDRRHTKKQLLPLTLSRRNAICLPKLKPGSTSPPTTPPPACVPFTPNGSERVFDWAPQRKKVHWDKRESTEEGGGSSTPVKRSPTPHPAKRCLMDELDDNEEDPPPPPTKVQRRSHTEETPPAAQQYYEDPMSLSDQEKESALLYMTIMFLKKEAEKNEGTLLGTVFGKFLEVETPRDLAALISETSYSNSVIWDTIKLITLGMYKNITMGTSKWPRKRDICPVQFGGIKGVEADFCSLFNQALGNFGEDWAGKYVIADAGPYSTPKKICDPSFPVCSTTPDYILHTNKPHPNKDLPVRFAQGSILGVGECKSSSLCLSTHPVWQKPGVTVEELLKTTKPANIQNIFFYTRTSKQERVPDWLTDKKAKHLFDEVRGQIRDTMKWYLKYWENQEDEGDNSKASIHAFDMSLVGNKVYLKPFATDQAKQMMSEAQTCMQYVDGNKIKVVGLFPSVLNHPASPSHDDSKASGGDFKFSVAYCIYFTVDLSIQTLADLYKISRKNTINAILDVALKSHHQIPIPSGQFLTGGNGRDFEQVLLD